MADGPEVVNALNALLEENGWTLVQTGPTVYAAEKASMTVDPIAAASTPAGLVAACRSFDSHLAGSKPDFLGPHPRTIIA